MSGPASRPRGAWHEVAAREAADKEAARPPSRWRVLLRSALPPVVVAGLLAVLGRERAAQVVLVLGLSLALAATASVRFRSGMERVLARVGHWVGHAITVGLMAVVEALVFFPASLLFRATGHDPLVFGRQRRRDRRGGWQAHPDQARRVTRRQPYGIEPAPLPPTGWRRPLHRAPLWVGAAALLILLDLAVGSIWFTVGDRATVAEAPVPERVAAATGDAPWFEDHRAEVEGLSYDFVPFVINRPDDASGRYVNVEAGVRRSYEPEVAAEDPPTVWVFGGTNVWGEGQRDDHTLPSALARVAEAAGAPLDVVNFGQRGDVGFGAMLRLEQALAGAGTPPDLVVMADGPDDYAVQRAAPSSQPSHHAVEVAADAVGREDDRSLLQRYRDLSLVQRVVTRLQSMVPVMGAQPALAQDVEGAEDGDGPDALEAASAGDLVEELAAIYERGRLMAMDIAAAHDVEVVHAWLPIEDSRRSGSAYARATDRLDPSVIDLSDALAEDRGGQVYLDGFRLTEHGARMAAAALHEALRTRSDALGGGSG